MNMYSKIAALCLISVFLAGESNLCSIDICFTWKVTTHALILKCKVATVIHTTSIFDKFGTFLADCAPPPPNVDNCDSEFKNGSIVYDANTNETIYTLTGKIDHHLNGNWTCRHGKRLDIAQVEVTVLLEKMKNWNQRDILFNDKTRKDTLSKSFGNECITLLLCWLFGSLIISLVIFLPVFAVITSISGVAALKVNSINVCISTCGCIREEKLKWIFVMKTILMSVLVLIALILASIVGHMTGNDNCTIATVVFTVLGAAVGIFSSLLIVEIKDMKNGDKKEEDSKIKPDEETKVKQLEVPEDLHAGVSNDKQAEIPEDLDDIIVEHRYTTVENEVEQRKHVPELEQLLQ